uniref:At1g61320/AtMIF1 LRR domain-containing protein n=1 Tax=Leersia perrieri TaxID=77586 RepID=A0A0D9WBV2_9ORYZ
MPEYCHIKTFSSYLQCQAVDPLSDDRLSALPDDCLIDILQRLELRNVAQTTILARRWSHLFWSMTRLKLDITEFMPRKSASSARKKAAALQAWAAVVQARAMSRYTKVIRTLLAPRSADLQQTTIRTMHLRFYPTARYLLSIGRMVDDAVQSARSLFQACPNAFRLVTSLSLWAIRFRDSDIPNLLGSCHQLQHLHLRTCDNGRNSVLKIDAPHSQLRTLKMIFCSYRKVELIHVPKLECVDCDTWMGPNPPVYFGRVPLLHKIRFCSSSHKIIQLPFKLSNWLSTVPTLTALHLDFQDEMVWILPEEPKKLFPLFRNLSDVYLYSISPDCGLDWTLFVLEGAPSIKRLYITISFHICCEDDVKSKVDKTNAVWEASSNSFKHKKLRLLDVGAFEADENMIKYIRLAIQIHLHDKEPCEDCDKTYLKMPSMSRTRFPNNEVEKDILREHLLEGSSSSVEIIIGEY